MWLHACHQDKHCNSSLPYLGTCCAIDLIYSLPEQSKARVVDTVLRAAGGVLVQSTHLFVAVAQLTWHHAKQQTPPGICQQCMYKLV